MLFKYKPLTLTILAVSLPVLSFSATTSIPKFRSQAEQNAYIQQLLEKNKAQERTIQAQNKKIQILSHQPVKNSPSQAQYNSRPHTPLSLTQAQKPLTSTDNNSVTPLPINGTTPPKSSLFQFNSPIPIDFSGFATAGAGISSSAQPYQAMEVGNIDNQLRLNNIQLGLQMNAHITDNLSAVGQLVANNASQNDGQFKVQPDWAFLNYQLDNNWSVSVGRMRIPIYLYSSNFYVGTSYPWVSPPAEVYNLMPIYNFNGAQITWDTPLGQSAWSINTKLYGGYIDDTVNVPLGPSTLTSHNAIGFDTRLTNNIFTFNLAAMHMRFDISPFPQTGTGINDSYANLITAGAAVNYHNFFSIIEGGVRNVAYEIPSNQSAYATFGYNIGKWQPSITFAALRTSPRANRPASYITPDGQKVDIMNTQQNSVTVDLKYHLKPNVTLTLEDEYVHPLNGSFGFFAGFRNGNSFQVSSLPGNVNIIRASISAAF
ncbi:hypothetical protein Psal006b_01525 [Piscirickettsia salmonis]|uniref:Porin n=1 Tax=Piscirickettsia salmonis TaxID=1238 RepID=A0A1L6TC07_PISSA|nr:hypothetical protein [Piscirickettsia salmonis]AKP74017.1 hypothetical protein PSLF89_2296 [Piscirickettsia salmonis LF-89 = ATCC VR-1361]ALB22865.1 porin [Piscirickettsia salmonis]ALY02839.1 hypothetical protein AWE47_08225 [Piscirickettsia salmonis]AMA42394.1 hypothetical protein AWJ11_08440 [Piscirickettsia salmonis]AOS34864.1 hypothetical protein AVM72_05580 [Piscirickettsia salmonis]